MMVYRGESHGHYKGELPLIRGTSYWVMRSSLLVRVLVSWWSCRVAIVNVQGQSDGRGKTPYDFVNPLIGTINGG